MMHLQILVPFKIDEVYSGFAEAEGIMKYDERYLIFEMQTKIIGIFKSGIKQYKIPLDEIYSFEYKKKMMGGLVTIRPNSMIHLNDFPTEKMGEISLKISRKHREAAEDLTRAINTIIIDNRLNDIDGRQ